jgi:hypothetical protein
MEFWIFLLCMETGATNEGQTEIRFIVLRCAGCGGSRRKDSSSDDALLWSVYFTLLSSRAPLIPKRLSSCGVTLVFGKRHMFRFVWWQAHQSWLAFLLIYLLTCLLTYCTYLCNGLIVLWLSHRHYFCGTADSHKPTAQNTADILQRYVTITSHRQHPSACEGSTRSLQFVQFQCKKTANGAPRHAALALHQGVL